MRVSAGYKKQGLIPLVIIAASVAFALVGTARTWATDRALVPQPQPKAADVARDPIDLPPPVGNRPAGVVHVMLSAREVVGMLDASTGTTYRYWTFNGKVPGPFIRVRQGDTVVVTLQNDKSDLMVHSIDLHAALGPGGGASLSQVPPGQSKTFSFQATTPGLYVYHCGTPMVAEHIANGMYGLILVEPPGGLPHVDHEYYIMQGEIYTASPKGKPGLQRFSSSNLMQEAPQYFVFNGSVDATSGQHVMHSNVGETVRIFFGDAGPNATASEHMIGEIFSKVYQLGSLTSAPLTGVQTATIPSGGAAIFEMKTSIPGKFPMMDHAMSRMEKGLLAVLEVKGAENTALMHEGPTAPAPGTMEISGITAADESAAKEGATTLATYAPSPAGGAAGSEMSVAATSTANADGSNHSRFNVRDAIHSAQSLIGCETVLGDGRVILKVFNSQKTYRLEAQPLLFSAVANQLIHVSGSLGSVLPSEDPRLPSFVVSDVDVLASNCFTPMTTAEIRRQLAPPDAPVGGTVMMGHMSFLPATITITAGEQVVWKNTSDLFHDVVDDPARATNLLDVSLPGGAAPFYSHAMQPGAAFAHVFDRPGVYHYVCVLHESNGMKGTVIVKPAQLLAGKSTRQIVGQ